MSNRPAAAGPSAETGRRAPVDRRRRGGWPAVGAVAAVSFALVVSEFLPVGLLPAISGSLGVHTGTAGLLVVVPGLVAAAAAPLLTTAAGRLDRRHVLLALAALISATGLLAYASTATAPRCSSSSPSTGPP
ncbi:hypothetical protein [Streptomyces sp. NPDC048385]|uniref:hypothetical protein n=1 Tax=unclassified Streptomyces TaxID=2593676 RepID=UPI00344213C3